MNHLNIIQPFVSKYGSLVFNDDRVGLVEEPFVNGADVALKLAAKSVGADPKRFELIFSANRFPGYQFTAKWLRDGFEGDPLSGDWYEVALGGYGMEAWLCPALLRYFEEAPEMIYFQIKPI